VFLTDAPVDKPLPPFDDDAERSLIENCWIKEAKLSDCSLAWRQCSFCRTLGCIYISDRMLMEL
jgi:hypothetical protein